LAKEKEMRKKFFFRVKQGCQIFLGTTYQNGKKYTKWPQNRPNGRKNIPTPSIASPTQIYPN
jgi:hypothetical protein